MTWATCPKCGVEFANPTEAGSHSCRFGAKAEWFEGLVDRKRARGYSEDEVARFRAGLEERYAAYSDAEFEAVLADRARPEPEPEPTTAWDLAGGGLPEDAEGFTIGAGTTVWEDAVASSTEGTVRVARLVPLEDGRIRQVNRYVDPETPIRLVRAGEEER